MKIIVGLGNPGKEYIGSRHNAGFDFLDKLIIHPKFAQVDSVNNFRLEKKFKAMIAETTIAGQRFILVKPQTFMNLSGDSVGLILAYYKESVENLLIISDDLDLPIGFLRIRRGGSSGGHKGLQSIIDSLESDAFIRFRIGISEQDKKIPQAEVNDYVLSRISKRAKPIYSKILSEGVDYLVKYIKKIDKISAHTLEVQN